MLQSILRVIHQSSCCVGTSVVHQPRSFTMASTGFFAPSTATSGMLKTRKSIGMLAEIKRQKGGKRPNILYILIDDVSFGQMGQRAMNYVTGFDTPNINQLASESLSLMRMYTEPSCTPTRAAFLTGRHPVRIGIKEVKVALVGEGLQESEVTIAEVLSRAGIQDRTRRQMAPG